ncbi:MAG TPA: hypothetical protein PLZ43_14700, partial [bacterium]|nr:hypothetical protein [bacterium]
MKNAITMIAIMLMTVVLIVSCGDDGNDEKKVVNDGSESCDTSGIYRCNGTQPEVCGIAYWKNSMKLTWNTSVDGNTQLKDCAEYGDDYVCELTESVIGTTIAECKKVDNNDDQNFDDFDVVEIKDDDDSVADDSDIDTDDTKASSWTAIAAGNYHTCGIRTDDKLYCWGYNIIGQLGNGTSGIISDMYIIPTKTGDDSWSAIVAGGDHTCGIRKSDSKLYCWGRNDYGEIGDGTEEAKNIPIKIGDDRWLAIAAGSNHTCGIKSDSTLYCWGKNVYGQLGDETDGYGTEKLVPTKIGNDTWSAITV